MAQNQDNLGPDLSEPLVPDPEAGHGHSHGHSHGHTKPEPAGGHGHSHGGSAGDDEAENKELIPSAAGGHGHSHGADEDPKNPNEARNKLIKATLLCFCFMMAELVGGYLAHSLAIMTDAAHLLSDMAGFAISIIAISLAKKEATMTYSFGFHRAEILGALASVMLIWALTAVLVYEAIMRLQDTKKLKVEGMLMFIISTLGILVNGAMMLVLGGHGHSHAGGGGHAHGAGEEHEEGEEEAGNINVEAAWVHVIGDLVQGIGVMIAAVLIWWAPGMTTCGDQDPDCGYLMHEAWGPSGHQSTRTVWVGQDKDTFKSGINWYIADPVCTLLFSVLVMYTTVGIVRSSVGVLMSKAPPNVNVAKLQERLGSIPGVTGVHELHCWMVSVGKNAVSAHLDIESLEVHDFVSKEAVQVCEAFGLGHSTVQLDHGGNCAQFDHGADWNRSTAGHGHSH